MLKVSLKSVVIKNKLVTKKVGYMTKWLPKLDALNLHLNKPELKIPTQEPTIKAGSIFSAENIKKTENPDGSVSYAENGITTTYIKDESGELKAVEYHFEHGDRESVKHEYNNKTQTTQETFREGDLQTRTTVYEDGKPEHKTEIFAENHKLKSRETRYKNGKPDYQIETFKDNEEIKQKEYFYDKNGNATIKSTHADGSISIKKAGMGEELYFPFETFGKQNAKTYILKGNELQFAGDFFNNKYGITLEDLHLPNLQTKTINTPDNLPQGTLVTHNGEIGMFKNGKFVSYAPDNKGTAQKEYTIDNIGFPDKLARKEVNSGRNKIITEYEYKENVANFGKTYIDGRLLCEVIKDTENDVEILKFASDREPFSRIRKDRKGNEITEFYNNGKWSTKYPNQPVKIPNYEMDGVFDKDAKASKLLAMPVGTEVSLAINGVKRIGEKQEVTINGQTFQAYVFDYKEDVGTSKNANSVHAVYAINDNGTISDKPIYRKDNFAEIIYSNGIYSYNEIK